MRNNLGRHIYKLLKNPRFWIGFVFLLLLSFVFDLTVATFVAAHGVLSGKWNQDLLTVGFVYVAINVGLRYVNISYKKDILKLNRLLIVGVFVWALVLYGFFKALYFIVIILLAARLLRMFTWVIKQYIPFRRTVK